MSYEEEFEDVIVFEEKQLKNKEKSKESKSNIKQLKTTISHIVKCTN